MAYGDIPSCQRCGDTYELRPGCEPTPECDSCAHIALAELREHNAKLRDLLADVLHGSRDQKLTDYEGPSLEPGLRTEIRAAIKS